ncbi:hypothetical protein Acr_06g0008600 [Actinidia rufa]|uniref:CCHC-type domain-containing protein n=1 Tax=Actinidia rufa TaxID=165716 RepID=A0A7J0ERI0_9ERIC|nr:hypothetical protein Acr_06g0008600 [Actinidia rufa]
MPPRNARGRAKSLTGARGARGARGTRRNLDEGDDHQESVMGGRASAPVENVGNIGGAPPTILVPIRAIENRATTAMKAFLQLRPPTFKGELDPLVTEDWLEQVTRALDTILVTEEELRVLFAFYQLQGDALQWWKTVEEVQYPTRSLPATSIVSSGQTYRGGLPCFGCHQPGHCVMDCPLKGQQRQSQQGGQSHIQAQGQSLVKGPPTCFQCGQVGHISRQCTQKENNQGATGSQQPTRSVQASRVNPAFTSAQPSYQSRPQAVTQQGQRT